MTLLLVCDCGSQHYFRPLPVWYYYVKRPKQSQCYWGSCLSIVSSIDW